MTTPEQQALQLAAQAWCTPATSGLEMDVNLATAVAEKFAPIIAENAALKAELERERMRLVACGVVALADTPESAATARKMHPDYESASCADVAWRVDECIRLRAELEAIQQGAGEPVAWSVTMDGHHTDNLFTDEWRARNLMRVLNTNFQSEKRAVVPLYTRPCVPLTDAHVRDFVNDVGLDWQSGWTLDECEPNRYVQLSRAVEAHIKGDK